jgi:hypothetical protein
MSMVEIEEKKYSHIKFESYLNANPVYCNINGTLQNPDDSESSIQRIGDQIQQLGFNVKMTFCNKQDHPNVTWKVRVVSTPRTYYTDGSGNSGTFPKTYFYRQVTGNCLLDDVETGIYKVHKSLTFKNPQIQTVGNETGNANACVTTRQFYVQAPCKIKYTTNGSQVPSTGRDYFVVAPPSVWWFHR